MAGLLLGAGLVVAPLVVRPAPATLHHVEIREFKFVPARIEVRRGDVIEWTNRDFVPHTATADGGRWSTKDLPTGATGQIVMIASGTMAYHCKYHPQMAGTVVVSSRRTVPAHADAMR